MLHDVAPADRPGYLPELFRVALAPAELGLAIHGSLREIDRYLDRIRDAQGRDAELRAADLITAARKQAELAEMIERGEVLNPSDPGGPGTTAEHVAMLRVMAEQIAFSRLYRSSSVVRPATC